MKASELVRRLFDAYETSAEPDTYEGREGARRYFAAFDGALDEVRFELVEIHHDSPAGLIGGVRLSGVGEATRIVAHPTLESARAEVSTPE